MSTLTQFISGGGSGSSGGIKSVQRGTTALNAGTAVTVNTTITAVNLAKSFVTSSCQASAVSVADGLGGLSYFIPTGAAFLTTTTNIACKSSAASNAGSAVEVYWEVIEFF